MKVNLDLTGVASANAITDELLTNVGSSSFPLVHSRFAGGAGLVVRTASGGGGTLLTAGVDYSPTAIDATLTGKAGFNVYGAIIVVNATYQTGNLYFTYHAVADLINALDQYDIERIQATQFIQQNSDGSIVVTASSGLAITGTGAGSFGTGINGTLGWLQFKTSGGLGGTYPTSFGSNTDGLEIVANKNSGTGDIHIDNRGTGGHVLVKDQAMSSFFGLGSQTNAIALSANFAYNTQTDFNWTVRATGTSAIASLIGALNANRDDLYEYVELVRTEGAVVGVAAGANLVGVHGITGITPTGKGSGDDSNLQEMIEGIALAATGGGVISLNGNAGALVIAAGQYISVSTVGSTISIINLMSSGSQIQNVGSLTAAGTASSYFARADHIHQGIGQVQITGNTSNTSNAVFGSLFLGGGNNITLSQTTGVGAATVNIIGPPSMSHFMFPPDNAATTYATSIGQSSLSIQYFLLQHPLAMSVAKFYLSGAYTSSAQTQSVNLSMYAGIYTLNVSTLSLLASASTQYSTTASGNSGATTIMTGPQGFTIPFTQTTLVTPGDYWLGFLIRSQTTNVNTSFQLFPMVGGLAQITGTGPSEAFGASASATSRGFIPMMGIMNAQTTAMPDSINRTAIVQTGTAAQMANLFGHLYATNLQA